MTTFFDCILVVGSVRQSTVDAAMQLIKGEVAIDLDVSNLVRASLPLQGWLLFILLLLGLAGVSGLHSPATSMAS